MIELRIPEMGESVTGGILAAWLKQDGDFVAVGEEVLELETDKATLAVPSPAAGALKILIREDSEVEIGQLVAEVDTQAVGESPKPLIDKENIPAEDHYSPSVRHALQTYGLKSIEMPGSGKKGHLTKEDVLDYVQKQGIKAVPLSGSSTETPVETPAVTPAETQEFRRVKMSRIRQKIAANLVQSKQQSAHLTTFNEVDMSEIMEIRTLYKDDFFKSKAVKLGFMSFFVKAVCAALAEYPQLNAVIEGEDLLYRNHLNISIAVSTEKGLITPVLKRAETLSFAQIESQIISFSKRAAERKLLPDELSGGTFTITNGGIFGSLLSTPIPSPGQSGILGMHSIVKKPVVRNDEIVIRPMMYLALTYDHRIIDGREAVSFLNILKKDLEDPRRILIDL
ncbi:2-oxoglutarate dehydrogenase complex dihydrolipoyllysine-residue succinyltransferase [Oceanispirochaeta crateris]|uniref:Dihydrolipoyllysine-residue succinyltransferase component of 2-oxoglutarate dehydrogenase complex n=1 Tax=Oceanispirochaeta crateris TaxID=2518645 RepID=A0A5C1QIW9_9SPIO|nr:2-oxoglutarate dehydrogenase complex dihydrolipoyllysine-residue succinyltransferase [Oceanispirochaeta crateris]QEN06504.1 2-oxoglutarate dehydrogenase complex dihydrolipoyllysine-residue succinyltransferase [Oceanispirochaeta crateris]